MLNSYIKNIDSFDNNCVNHVEKMNLNVDYDGNQAEVLLKTNSNGRNKMYHYTLDNRDLANILNIDSVKMPIHKRLKIDFKPQTFKPQTFKPIMYRIEMPEPEQEPEPKYEQSITSINDNFLSSPASNEEFIVPRQAHYTFTPKRRNLTLKSRPVYKRPKSYRRRAKTSPRSYRR